jgi:hypothetical protein
MIPTSAVKDDCRIFARRGPASPAAFSKGEDDETADPD